jgi:anti-sigma factor (TIGR02949 family)
VTRPIGPLDRYTCEQVFRLLDEYVDRELAAEEVTRVEQHLATCAQCAAEYRFEGTLLEGLKEKIRHIDVPRSAVEKVKSVLKAHLDSEPPDGNDGAGS